MDFPNSSGIRSPFSPRVRQPISGRRSLNLSTMKKSQGNFMHGLGEHTGEVIYKTPHITLESFGTPLPVMVTEALTFGSGSVSVRMSACGWCWAVSGRRVLVWSAPHSATPARELTLPQTDLAHKADLVLLFYEGNAQMPSCVGVSPEGVVRYWPSVAQGAVFVEQSCELQGQECARLAEPGLVLATTTCTVVVITTMQEDTDGRPSVSCRMLRPPSGWLGGLGRRVSLLFFGSMPSQTIDTRLVGVVVLGEADGVVALVARGPVLQLWERDDLHEHDLRRALAAAHPEMGNMELVCVDVRSAGPSTLALLLAAVSPARDHHIRYAIAHVSVADVAAPRVLSLSLGGYRADCTAPLRLLPLGARSALYSHTHIALVSNSVPTDKVEVIEVGSEGDRILGAELCGPALVFSAKHGVMLLSCRVEDRSVCESPMASPCPSDMYDGNLSLYEIDPNEVRMVSTDACGRLKTALLFHVRREHAACRRELQELFPAHAPAPAAAALDVTVLAIAREMLDDIPAGDPRWKQPLSGCTRIPLGSSAALQLGAQLSDKQRALSLYVDFLRATGLWQRLTFLTDERGEVRTVELLARLPEKLAMAQALHALHAPQGPSAAHIDAALYQVVSESDEDGDLRGAVSAGTLSHADVCFRRVSCVERVLAALCALAERERDAPADAVHHILHIITTVVADGRSCRAQWARSLGVRVHAPLGGDPLHRALAQLHRRLFSSVLGKCVEPTARAQVLEHAVSLTHHLLEDARALAEDECTRHEYEELRAALIRPFMEEQQWERAGVLAEKFQEFPLLVEMCATAGHYDKLHAYIDKYMDQGLLEAACTWLADRGGAYSVALVTHLGTKYPTRVHNWLSGQDSRLELLALHSLQQRQLTTAARALAELAVRENRCLQRMTSMASLGKLALLASTEPAAEEEHAILERWLELAEHHAALPRSLRPESDSCVLSPEQLIQLYVSGEDCGLSEYDYKKALDLTDFVDDMEARDELRLKIWCAAIKQDDWTSCRVDNPSDELQEKTFFRLIHLTLQLGGDLALLLPPLEDILTARELADLLSDTAQYIIKYGYECLHDTPAH